MKRLLSAILALAIVNAYAGQLYYSPVTVNSSQVPSTQTNYPYRIFQTDARFKDVAHGGHVNRSDGFDIRPYSDSGLTTPLTYELAFYDPVNGTVEMYVKESSIADGTVAYLGYGDTSITTDGTSTATWSNGFVSVYHLKDGTTLNVTDSTGTNNGTNHGVTATAGQIDGAGSFVIAATPTPTPTPFGGGQYVDLGKLSTGTSAITMSCWVKGTSFPNLYNTTIGTNDGTTQALIFVKRTGKLAIYTTSAAYDGTGSHTLLAGNWYYLAMTCSSFANLIGYVNAQSDKSVS